MLAKVRYSNLSNGSYRPYLEVIFFNPANGKSSIKTFGLLDSGADLTIIPFSIGLDIKLKMPTPEEFRNIGGIGGNMSHIERKCQIFLINRYKNKIYAFDETVSWAYPDQPIQNNLNNLLEEFRNLNELKGQCKDGSDLYRYFENQVLRKRLEIESINNKFEPNILLGRPFFNNFKFIQILQRDRKDESKCSLNYLVDDKKVISAFDIEA